jgi:CRISPR/Cas system CMR-associated protein Cmr1 (group 7 of RAMP superfamily)
LWGTLSRYAVTPEQHVRAEAELRGPIIKGLHRWYFRKSKP